MYYRFKRTIGVLVAITGFFPDFLLRSLLYVVEPLPGTFFVLVRYLVLRNICRSVGDNVFVGSYVEIRFPERLTMGSNVSINRNCYLDAMGNIDIGDDVSIAHQCSLVAFEHGYKDPNLPIRKNPLEPAPIRIDSDVWIGAGVRILAGAKIGPRCIVAAGSVVTRKTEAAENALIAGVPARPRKSLTTSEGSP